DVGGVDVGDGAVERRVDDPACGLEVEPAAEVVRSEPDARELDHAVQSEPSPPAPGRRPSSSASVSSSSREKRSSNSADTAATCELDASARRSRPAAVMTA